MPGGREKKKKQKPATGAAAQPTLKSKGRTSWKRVTALFTQSAFSCHCHRLVSKPVQPLLGALNPTHVSPSFKYHMSSTSTNHPQLLLQQSKVKYLMKVCRPFCQFTQKCSRRSWVERTFGAERKEASSASEDNDLWSMHLPFSSGTAPPCGYSTTEAVRLISLPYHPHVYAYCLFESRLIFERAVLHGAIAPNVKPSQFFVHPISVIRHPEKFKLFFGEERSDVLLRLLVDLLGEYDGDDRSVVQKCRAKGVSNENWVPFLRGLGLCLAMGDIASSQATFVMEDCITGGGADCGLSLPGSYEKRGSVAAELLMEASVELGSLTLANLSLSLYRQFLPEVPLTASKKVTICTTRCERRFLEWNQRCLKTGPRR
ncbi:hypothetical protein, conserved [Trypanosoma brucei gambiense DAL972]|uniref:Uncharacterized protein n=1 Tax=Trypanosoma brucei gambiense (strain MHOM/CI/86/DAL972) TaxID=679716 RepID=D0A975_TRYB9|nr:hypothetical protein, conserved [Trypanosoma brucei gambiense DAL972]CBH18226.1 hypothetical protein, conserved [Trypanosoma brucei gambiense DAL972]|eukprot:XP_011780490.1 hypothetical protein, conserved [Trypanosoma brucei gambiense DAL972]